MQYDKRIIKAGAGTGKTTLLINQALNFKSEGKVLYLTYTRNNLRSMKEDIVNINGVLPKEVECRTWIEFLLNELAKPYRKMVGMPPIEGLDNTLESEIPRRKGVHSNTKRFYINQQNKLYSERLAQFIDVINKKTKGCIFDRIERMYSTILIDEIQDLNGYDLEILRELFQLSCNIIIVGDHRQSTYSTNTSTKHRKYKNDKIFNFFREEMGITDIEELKKCYRCNQAICDFVNQLFEDLNLVADSMREEKEGEGIFLLKTQADLSKYIEKNQPTILYYNATTLKKIKKSGVPDCLEFLTFGKSKGVTRDHVVIFPTKAMNDHARGKPAELKDQTLAKYYVALTRAKYSVAIYIG
ncbi:UvrD-helicase domain-containing protein [Evansella clarkii]|uniref:UvrD-helicase domain-containing protein n=1 Tax=Evansella clarkii TaxID=79879 RepID=UPI000B432AC3|nr:UvrD-helicase domain-containing protein [Evansella clarkii]